MEEKIVYFENPGKENTREVINLVLQRAKIRNINRIVVASTRGNTAKSFFEAVEGQNINLVVVPWQFGFKVDDHPFPQNIVTSRKKASRTFWNDVISYNGLLRYECATGHGQSSSSFWARDQGLHRNNYDGL